MKKKFLALVLTLTMVLSLVPMTALAAENGQVEKEATVAAGETTNAGTNEGSQDSGSPTGGDNAGSGDNADTSKAPGANNKDEGKDSGSENTDETTPGSPSKPGGGGTTTEGGGTTTPEPETPENAAKIGEKQYKTIAAAIAEANDTETNTITLLRDVRENITIDKSLTLDLAGFKLTGTGTETVVKISGENLNIIVKDGTITGGNTNYGGGVNIQNVAGTVTLDNCTITKNEASNAGGGVYIASSGTVTIKDGKITENTAVNSGAGIYVTCGINPQKDGNLSCVLDGVMIETNTSNSNGGGIVASGNHPNAAMVTVTMENGTSISHNIAKTSLDGYGYGGGGVYITGSATRFIMNGGTISDNKALCGAGINSATRDGLEINGGSIVDNVATGDGGGIYAKRYKF